MGRLFGTDGVRGVANTELTPELAFRLGKVGAYVLAKKSHKKPTIVIAKDTRISGDMLESALSAGILSMGADVLYIGVMPTPAAAYLIKHYHGDAGIVISASHNSYEYNGIKFFSKKGSKLEDAVEDEIENMVIQDIQIPEKVWGEKLGRRITMEDAQEQYIKFLKNTVDVSYEGMKVVIDCANGAAYQAAETTLKELGADVTTIHNQPDGININVKCGSTHPNDLKKSVIKHQSDVGLAFDGDADRLIAVDEKGNIVDGDKIIYICSKMLKEEGKLKDNRVTATVMSNIGFYKALENLGCLVETTKVGDRYVLERMLEKDSVIGGEQSGHIIFLEHATTGDGILSALQLLRAIKKSGKKLSELADEVTIYPQVLINAKVNNSKKDEYEQDEVILSEIQRVEDIMASDGRVLIRPSGTEPFVRVMIEGKNEGEIKTLAKGLARLIEKRLG